MKKLLLLSFIVLGLNAIGKGGKPTYTKKRTGLHEAARKGKSKRIKMLLFFGYKINKKDSYGDTALMLAAQYNHLESLKELLRSGAVVDEKNNRGGKTALMLAAREGYNECVKMLLHAGADPLTRTYFQQNAFDMLRKKHQELRALLRTGRLCYLELQRHNRQKRMATYIMLCSKKHKPPLCMCKDIAWGIAGYAAVSEFKKEEQELLRYN